MVGCGGAGRVAAAGLKQAGAEVALVNRGTERGGYAFRLLGLPFVPLSEFDPGDFSLVVHATPLAAESPFPVEDLRADGVVVELVYGPSPTPLMTAARERGGVAIDGFAAVVGGFHFGEAARVAVEDAGEVHHLTEIQNPRIVEQFFDLGDRDLRAGSFESGRRHTGRCAEEKLERDMRRVFEHVTDTGYA